MPLLHTMSRKSRIRLAVDDFYERAEDWSHGKPDRDDIERMAKRAALDACVSVSFDEYGNPAFY